MTTVAETNTILIVIALLIGIAIAWWIFKRGRKTDDGHGDRHVGSASSERVEAPPASAPPPPAIEEERPVPARRDGPEGNSLTDQGAAATTDVAGQLLGTEVHSELPGASGPPDDLTILKGVGPKLAQKLNENGFTRFEQLARLSANEVDILEDQLGPFRGRIARDRVVEQASYLARGDTDGFEAKFGKLGSGS